MKKFRTLIQSGLSLMLWLGTATLFTGHAQAQFSSPIHDVDNAARQPVVFDVVVAFADGVSDASSPVFFTVPAGKRLVIETITGEIFVPIGQQVRVFLNTSLGQSENTYFLTFNSKVADDFGLEDIYIGTFSVRCYADSGTTPFLSVHRNATKGGAANSRVTFSGYLVNLP